MKSGDTLIPYNVRIEGMIADLSTRVDRLREDKSVNSDQGLVAQINSVGTLIELSRSNYSQWAVLGPITGLGLLMFTFDILKMAEEQVVDLESVMIGRQE